MYRYYLSAAVAVAVVSGFFIYGQAQYHKGFNAAQTQMRLQISEQENQHRQSVQQISQKYQAQLAQFLISERQQHEKLDQIITQNSLYFNRCFNDDGLRQLRQAIGGQVN